jgi:copper oxidase (laccase) domain-containing protein
MLRAIRYFRNNPYFDVFASTKFHGAMNIKAGKAGEKNRECFFPQNAHSSAKLFVADVEHKSKVMVVNSDRIPGPVDKIDALITSEEETYLGMPFADCHTLILSGFTFERRPTLALVHAGFNPLLQGIIANTVLAMDKDVGTRIKSVQAFIGPGICKNCYEFGPEAPRVFRKYGGYIRQNTETGKYFIDLKGIILEQLIFAGIEGKSISSTKWCTFESRHLFSARREKMRPKDPKNPVKTCMVFAGITGKKA